MKKLIFIIFSLILYSSCTKEYTLNVTVSPPEGGSVSPSMGTYKDGSSVSVVATPSGEYEFSRWSGDESGTSNVLNFEMNGNKNIVAQFVKRKYSLTINTQGEGTVSEQLISSGKSTDYSSGSVVKLTANPSAGYYFSGWSGAITGDTNPVEVNIDKPKTITAKFEKKSYALEVKIEGEGTVSEEIVVTGKSTDYLYGTTVRLKPTPSEGWDFIRWEEDHTGEENPLEITINGPTNITANFEYGILLESVGRWKVKKKKGTELPPIIDQKSMVVSSSIDVSSIIFNKDYSYILNTTTGQISGTFDVISNTEIKLINVGVITNISITGAQINFTINVLGVFKFDVSGTKDPLFQAGKVSIPDTNFEQALIDSGYDDALDTYVDFLSVLDITQLDLSNRSISDFSGLEYFTNLEDLNLGGNGISQIPLVNFTKLSTLNLSGNSFNQLDLSLNSQLGSLNISGNPNLTCVKVDASLLGNIPSGWIYDSTTSFELECDCPTLSLTSGSIDQTICSGDAIQPITFDFGGTGVLVNVDQTIPSGLTTSISNNTLTISGTPDLSNYSYSFSVYTTGGNQNCNQVSQTITINRDLDSPIINLISGSLVQTTSQGSAIQPIELTYGGAATDLSIAGLPTNFFSIVKNINAYTIQGSLRDSYTIRASLPFQGVTYTGSVTTISDGGCQEETRTIKITVQSAPGTTTGGTTTGGTTTGGTTYNTTTGNTTTGGTTGGTTNQVNFLAVGNGGAILTSVNGQDWTSRANNNVTGNLFGATYGNGVFVITGNDGTYTSSDGISWSRTGNGARKVLFANGKFVGGPGYSTDGINWSNGCGGWGIAYGDGKYVYVPYSYSDHTYSTDGFTCQTSAKVSYSYDSGQGYLWDLAYGNGIFVAAAGNGNNFYVTSPDGINWTQRFFNGSDHRMNTVSFINGRFVGVGGGGSIGVSSDGLNWSESKVNSDPNANGTLQSVTYGDGKYVIGGSIRINSGTFYDGVYTSTDLQNWTAFNIGASGTLGFYYMIYKN